MLPFRKITIEDKSAVERYTAMIPTHLCEHCFVDLFIWWDHYDTEICFHNDFLLIRCVSFPDKTPMYLAPIGKGDLKQAVKNLRGDAEARGVPFVMVSIPEEMLPAYEAALAGEYTFDWSEDSADYIYLSEKLRTLSGKKLQSKRNLINRFRAAHEGHWQYVPITPENASMAYEYHLKWCREHDGCAKDAAFQGETCAVKLALDHFAQLDLRGGMLLLDGNVIAYTLGCRARADLYVMQIEKADVSIDGAYQMINQQFVLANCADVQYVNREEDLGLEGLRKAKRSYYPAVIGKKYYALPVAEAQR